MESKQIVIKVTPRRLARMLARFQFAGFVKLRGIRFEKLYPHRFRPVLGFITDGVLKIGIRIEHICNVFSFTRSTSVYFVWDRDAEAFAI